MSDQPKIAVRFTEYERYDIMQDCDTVVFMATFDKGSFFTEVPNLSARQVREQRAIFRDRAIECMRDGVSPQRIQL